MKTYESCLVSPTETRNYLIVSFFAHTGTVRVTKHWRRFDRALPVASLKSIISYHPLDVCSPAMDIDDSAIWRVLSLTALTALLNPLALYSSSERGSIIIYLLSQSQITILRKIIDSSLSSFHLDIFEEA